MPTELYRADEVQRMIAAGAQIVDVLPPDEYEADHLPGAINIPLKTLDARTAERLDRTRAVIVYCHDAQ